MPIVIIFSLLIIAIGMFFQIFISKNHLFVIFLSSALSILIGTSYTVLMATDLAITEFVISSALSTIIMIFSLLYINSKKKYEGHGKKQLSPFKTAFLTLATLSLLFVINDAVDNLPRSFFEFQEEHDLQKFYTADAKKTFLIPSVVTTIVVGYRGLDTMFECCVIFFGSLVFYVILRDRDIQ